MAALQVNQAITGLSIIYNHIINHNTILKWSFICQFRYIYIYMRANECVHYIACIACVRPEVFASVCNKRGEPPAVPKTCQTGCLIYHAETAAAAAAFPTFLHKRI